MFIYIGIRSATVLYDSHQMSYRKTQQADWVEWIAKYKYTLVSTHSVNLTVNFFSTRSYHIVYFLIFCDYEICHLHFVIKRKDCGFDFFFSFVYIACCYHHHRHHNIMQPNTTRIDASKWTLLLLFNFITISCVLAVYLFVSKCNGNILLESLYFYRCDCCVTIISMWVSCGYIWIRICSNW